MHFSRSLALSCLSFFADVMRRETKREAAFRGPSRHNMTAALLMSDSLLHCCIAASSPSCRVHLVSPSGCDVMSCGAVRCGAMRCENSTQISANPLVCQHLLATACKAGGGNAARVPVILRAMGDCGMRPDMPLLDALEMLFAANR